MDVVHGQAELAEIVLALHAAGCFAGRLYGRQEQRDEDTDDGDDDEKLDESEG